MYKKYDREFKEMAIRMAISTGNTAATARDLGLEIHTLRSWLGTYYKKSHRVDQLDSEAKLKAELEQSQKRIAELEEECEILKKAAAYFAKDR